MCWYCKNCGKLLERCEADNQDISTCMVVQYDLCTDCHNIREETGKMSST